MLAEHSNSEVVHTRGTAISRLIQASPEEWDSHIKPRYHSNRSEAADNLVLFFSISGCYIFRILHNMRNRTFCDISVRLLKPAQSVLREAPGPVEVPFALLGLTGATGARGGAPGANQAAATHAHPSRSPRAQAILPYALPLA